MGETENNKAGKQVPRQQPTLGVHNTEVLGQRAKAPMCPMRAAIGGIAVIATIGYLTLFSHKKPEATALDVAKVATGTSDPSADTRPRN